MPYKNKKKYLEYERNYHRQRRKEHPEKIKQQTQRYYQKRKEKLRNLKINGCAICGYNRCDAALDFHHVNPEDRKFNIITTYIGDKNLINEINKCILLCKNCHMEIHHKER